MKLLKRRDSQLARGKAEDPPFVVPAPDNPFKTLGAVRIWARSGTRSNMFEIAIELENGLYLRGSFMNLPGFFDAGTKRPKAKRSLFDLAIDASGQMPKKE